MTDLTAVVLSTFNNMIAAGEISLSPDAMAYTSEFDALYSAVKAVAETTPTKGEVYKRLLALRKQGRLSLGYRKAKVLPGGITLAQRRILRALAEAARKGGGLTAEELQLAADVDGNLVASVGPIWSKKSEIKASEERYNRRSLMGLGLAKVEVEDRGTDTAIYSITPKGLTLLQEAVQPVTR